MTSQSKTKRTRSFNGCQSCKWARVRCDEKKPTCGRCARLFCDCQYLMTMARTIVLENQVTVDSISKQSKHDKGRNKVLHFGRLQTSPSPLPGQLEASAIKGTLIDSFLGFDRPRKVGIYKHTWLVPLVELPDKGPALTQALNAVAFSRLAWQRRDRLLHVESLRSYETALRCLQYDLQDPKHQWSAKTLASVHLLYVFENLDNTSLRSPSAHITGMVAYLCRNVNRTALPASPADDLITEGIIEDLMLPLVKYCYATGQPIPTSLITTVRRYWPYSGTNHIQNALLKSFQRIRLIIEFQSSTQQLTRLLESDPPAALNIIASQLTHARELLNHIVILFEEGLFSVDEPGTNKVLQDLFQQTSNVRLSFLAREFLDLLQRVPPELQVILTTVDVERIASTTYRHQTATDFLAKVPDLHDSPATDMLTACATVTPFFGKKGSLSPDPAHTSMFSRATGLSLVPDALARENVSRFGLQKSASKLQAVTGSFLRIFADEDPGSSANRDSDDGSASPQTIRFIAQDV